PNPPTTNHPTAERFFESSAWKKLRSAMCESRQVSLSTPMVRPHPNRVRGEPLNLYPGGHGMFFGGAILDPSFDDDPELPIACWWADTSGWKTDRISSLLV